MDRKATNKAMYDYIISIVDSEGYDVKTNTDKEKVQFVWDTFNSEYGWNISRVGEQRAFIEWLQGLPSSFNVDFENYRIIELGKEFGFLPENATERQEDKFIESWWARVYMAFRAVARKNKVDLVRKMAKGGDVPSAHSEEIKKLRAVVNSPNIGEALKAKAQARIDMLEEKAGKSTPAPKAKKSSEKKTKLTSNSIQKALNNREFYMDKKDSAIIDLAVEKGFVLRPSHTQAEWTDKGAKHFGFDKPKTKKTEAPKKERKESAIDYAKRTRKDGESWQDAIKRASKELKNGGKPVAKKIKRTEKKAKPVAKKIKKTVKKSKAEKLPRTIKRVKYLNGSTTKSVDKTVKALPAGKRISKSKKTYYEYRANRADLNRTKKLEEGGELGDNYNIVYDKPNSDVAYKQTINAKSEKEARSKFKKEHPSCEILSIRKSI